MGGVLVGQRFSGTRHDNDGVGFGRSKNFVHADIRLGLNSDIDDLIGFIIIGKLIIHLYLVEFGEDG